MYCYNMGNTQSRQSADTLATEMNLLLNHIFGSMPEARPQTVESKESKVRPTELSPDIYESADELVFILPLPGVAPEDIQIEATGETLTLKGERKPTYANENASRKRQGTWNLGSGNFQTTWKIPFEIEAGAVQANFKNGVLELHLPKVKPLPPHSVKISVNGEEKSLQIGNNIEASVA